MDDYNWDAITRFAMKLMAYMCVRTSEEIEAPWTEFDLDNARWTIPPERMKMDTPPIVPLSRRSVEVLRALKLLTGNGRLAFPGANDKNKPMSNNTILYALYRLGYRDRMTGHGFRAPAQSLWRIDIPPVSITDLRWNGGFWNLRKSGCPFSRYEN